MLSPLCVTYDQQTWDVVTFRVTLGEHCVGSWRQVGGNNFRLLSRSGGVAGRYLKTRRQVAGQMGVAGFTRSGQPEQRLGGVSGGGCKMPALLEQSSRWEPQRVHTPGTQEGQGRIKSLAERQRPHLPFSINQPLPPSNGCTDNTLTSETLSPLLKPRSVDQSYSHLFLLLSSYFCFCHHRWSVWVLSPSQVLFIFSRSLKSLYVLPRAGLRNNPRFFSLNKQLFVLLFCFS